MWSVTYDSTANICQVSQQRWLIKRLIAFTFLLVVGLCRTFVMAFFLLLVRR